MICVKADSRITLQEIYKHSWMNKNVVEINDNGGLVSNSKH
jgi:hypothetical protein